MNKEEKDAIDFFIHECEKYDGTIEIKGTSVGEETRILNTIVKYLKELNSLKEIEQQHKTDNGLLRQELDMQIEHNKELEATLKQTQDSWFEDTQKLEQEKEKNNNLIKQLQEQNTEIQDISRQLRQEKEKNKELNEALERSSGRVTKLIVENSDLKYQLYHKQQMIDELTQSEEKLKIELGKEKERNELFVADGNSINLERHIKNNYISKDKIMKLLENEIVDINGFRYIAVEDIENLLEGK